MLFSALRFSIWLLYHCLCAHHGYDFISYLILNTSYTNSDSRILLSRKSYTVSQKPDCDVYLSEPACKVIASLVF